MSSLGSALDTGTLVISKVGKKNKAQCSALLPLLHFVTREISLRLCKLLFLRHIGVLNPAMLRQPKAYSVIGIVCITCQMLFQPAH